MRSYRARNGLGCLHSSILGRGRGLMNPHVEHRVSKNEHLESRQKHDQQRAEGETVLNMGPCV